MRAWNLLWAVGLVVGCGSSSSREGGDGSTDSPVGTDSGGKPDSGGRPGDASKEAAGDGEGSDSGEDSAADAPAEGSLNDAPGDSGREGGGHGGPVCGMTVKGKEVFGRCPGSQLCCAGGTPDTYYCYSGDAETCPKAP